MNHADGLSVGKLHRQIIQKKGFPRAGKSGKVKSSTGNCLHFPENLSLDISLLGSQEIFPIQEALRFGNGRDQIQFSPEKLLRIAAKVRTFLLQIPSQLLPGSVCQIAGFRQPNQSVFTADIGVGFHGLPQNGQIILVLKELLAQGFIGNGAAFQFNIHDLIFLDLE